MRIVSVLWIWIFRFSARPCSRVSVALLNCVSRCRKFEV